MVTEREVSGSTPIADSDVRSQVAQLFGESLFGAWPELEQQVVKPRRRNRWRRWLYRFGAVAAVAGVVSGGQWLMRPGLDRHAVNQRDNYAEELQSFLNDGDLARVSQYLPLVRDGAPGNDPNAATPAVRQALDPKAPKLELILGTEATLYRFFDADPARLSRILPHLDGPGASGQLRRLARLTLLSREERAAHLVELEQIHNDLPNRNDAEYLLATALEFKKETTPAREAWARSERLGPAWLGQRFEQAWFEAHDTRQGAAQAAQKVARQIQRVDPDSPWAKLAAGTFGLPQDSGAPSVRSDAAAPVASPVQIHFERLQQSISSGRASDLGSAKQQLEAAVAAIHQQPPFLLDAFDWLVAEKQVALARHLIGLPAWPRDEKLAAVKAGRLGAKP